MASATTAHGARRRCNYSTTTRSVATRFGERTTDEMCFNFLMATLSLSCSLSFSLPLPLPLLLPPSLTTYPTYLLAYLFNSTSTFTSVYLFLCLTLSATTALHIFLHPTPPSALFRLVATVRSPCPTWLFGGRTRACDLARTFRALARTFVSRNPHLRFPDTRMRPHTHLDTQRPASSPTRPARPGFPGPCDPAVLGARRAGPPRRPRRALERGTLDQHCRARMRDD